MLTLLAENPASRGDPEGCQGAQGCQLQGTPGETQPPAGASGGGHPMNCSEGRGGVCRQRELAAGKWDRRDPWIPRKAGLGVLGNLRGTGGAAGSPGHQPEAEAPVQAREGSLSPQQAPQSLGRRGWQLQQDRPLEEQVCGQQGPLQGARSGQGREPHHRRLPRRACRSGGARGLGATASPDLRGGLIGPGLVPKGGIHPNCVPRASCVTEPDCPEPLTST